MRKSLCMVLMIALMLVSIFAIAVVPASAATVDVSTTDKALMIVANKGTGSVGEVVVRWADSVALGDSVLFDLENGSDLQIKVGNDTLSVKDADGKTYHSYKLDVTDAGATLSALVGDSYEEVSKTTTAYTESQTFAFYMSNSEILAKRAFVDNVVLNGNLYDFNYTDKTDAKPNTVESETEIADIYGSAIALAKTGYSDAYIHQEEFKVVFADINGGNIVDTVYVGYGKRVDVPTGYEVIDDADKEKIAMVESDAYIAVVESDNNLVGGVYLYLVNATFADGDYAGQTFGIFAQDTEVNVIADATPADATFHGWYTDSFDDVKDAPLSTEMTYTYKVTKNTVLTVDYNLVTYDVYVNGDVAATEETGDIATVKAVKKPGYIFKGFYNDEEMTDLYTEDDTFYIVMDSDKVFYAKYEAIIYGVVVNSGSVYVADAPEGEQYIAGTNGIYADEVTIVADPAPEGQHFIGWYSGAIKVTDETKSTYTFNITGNVSLTAKYALNPAEIIIIGGSVLDMISESADPEEYFVTVSVNDEITLIPETRDGYKFAGWKIGNAEDLVKYDNYNYIVESDITIEAIYESTRATIRVENGSIKNMTEKEVTLDVGAEITLIADPAPEGKVFDGWYLKGEEGENDIKKSVSATYKLYVTEATDMVLEARYVTPSEGGGAESGGGCGGAIMPTSGGNGGIGGMLMILGVLALATLAVVFSRNGKKIVKHASKVLGVVLCLAILCGAVVIPEATANATTTEQTGESVYDGAEYVLEYYDTPYEGVHEYVHYFPVVGFKLGDRVKVSMEIYIDRVTEDNEGWALTTFKGFGGEIIDDTLPMCTWTNIVYETRVISIDDGFAVALYIDVDKFFRATVKNVTVKPSVIETKLLGGATLYMLPNDDDVSNEQMNSFVLVTASGKVIVMDGGTHKDYIYLKDFLYSITSKVDAWFITHFHSDHIGALSVLLNQNDIYIDKLYYDFVDHKTFWNDQEIDESIVINEDFGFDNYAEMYAKGLGSDGGNSGTLLDNKMQSVYSQKYGDGVGVGKGSWSYLFFYDEVNKHLSRDVSDPTRMIGEVVKTNRGAVYTFDDVEFRILNDVQIHGANFGNNTTINWRINTAGVDMLFLGDSGNEVGDRLLADREPLFDDDGDGVKDSSVYDNLLGCTIIQAAHHGQNGVRDGFYKEIFGDIYLYCAPYDLFYDIGSLGVGTATTQCEIEREWQRQLGTVSKTYWMDGLVTIR